MRLSTFWAAYGSPSRPALKASRTIIGYCEETRAKRLARCETCSAAESASRQDFGVRYSTLVTVRVLTIGLAGMVLVTVLMTGSCGALPQADNEVPATLAAAVASATDATNFFMFLSSPC